MCLETYILEQRKHLIVGYIPVHLSENFIKYREMVGEHTRIVGDKEPNICIVQHGSDTNEPRTSTRHNGDVLPRVLARLALAVHLIVQMSHGLPQGLDSCRGAVLTAVDADVECLGTGEAAFYFVVYLFWKGDVRGCVLNYSGDFSSFWAV